MLSSRWNRAIIHYLLLKHSLVITCLLLPDQDEYGLDEARAGAKEKALWTEVETPDPEGCAHGSGSEVQLTSNTQERDLGHGEFRSEATK